MAYPVNNEPIHANKAVLEQLQLAFWTSIRKSYPPIGENSQLRLRELSYAVDELLMMVNTWILDGHKVDRLENTEIDFPATWWDFWKQSHAPKWMLKRWPVKLKTTKVTKHIHQHYVCPHINMKDDSHIHIAWMYESSGQKERDASKSSGL
jgi:hypothetical protein